MGRGTFLLTCRRLAMKGTAFYKRRIKTSVLSERGKHCFAIELSTATFLSERERPREKAVPFTAPLLIPEKKAPAAPRLSPPAISQNLPSHAPKWASSSSTPSPVTESTRKIFLQPELRSHLFARSTLAFSS